MMKSLRSYLLLALVLGNFGWSGAQVTVNMTDTLVTACQGILFDSDDGQQPGAYDHNENYTLTICPNGGVDSIVLNWTSFCTEPNFDYIRIFQGTDTNGVLLAGPISGSVLPPTIVSTTCITINFISDANVACTGWIADWQVYEQIPTPAVMTLVPNPPTCSTATLTANFDRPIHCDSIVGSNFSISSPVGQTITASAIACSNDSATSATINFSPGLNDGGTYVVDFTTFYRDACDSLWELTSSDTFTINDCPLSVLVTASPDTICPGGCSDLLAEGFGGDSTTYAFAWSNGLPPTAGPHTVCPNVTTTYTVTLSDASAAPPVQGQVTVVVLPPPTTLPDFNICESEPAITLTANPGGGTWSGPGVTDSLNGTFLAANAGPGVHAVYYTLTNGCQDSVLITVDAFDAGPTEAACPGTAPFAVSGFTPLGGTWSGPNITAGGIFNPATGGSYTVTYSLGGCTDTKTINVQNINLGPDTNYCSSFGPDTLLFTPLGGTWSIGSVGNNNIFDDPAFGVIDPINGDTINELVYTINGCSDTMIVTVFQVEAGDNYTVCPKGNPFYLRDSIGSRQTVPLGGTWSGVGVINGTSGLFDPQVQNQNYNALITYTVGNCSDQKYVYLRLTSVIVDTIPFCRDDSSIFTLNYGNTGRNPGGGAWTGPSIITAGQNATIRPADHGVGTHVYTYTRQNCSDSLVINIRPPNALTDTTICELEPSFQLFVSPPDHPAGGTWSGPGVVSPQGTFDPQTAGVGIWPIYYQSFYGCNDTSQIEVTPVPTVTFTGLASNYCYVDSVVPLALSPSGGILTGTGLVGNGFNPSLAGPGTHQLTYTYGQGACQRSTSLFTTVGIPLNMSLTATDDTICTGEVVDLNVQAFGGTGAYSYNWNQGLSPSLTQSVSPSQTTTYLVMVSDTCSDPVMDSVTIVVRQPYTVDFDTSAIQCYGETGYAVAIPSIPGDFSFTWDSDPPTYTDSLIAEVGQVYNVVVSDSGSGCVVSRSVTIPGYPSISANFTSNPSTCVPFDNPVFDFIDVSGGVDFGTWDFGDGAVDSYASGYNPQHRYAEVGEYDVSLSVQNIGGCTDTFSLKVCVDIAEVHVYNTFSPNNDGYNDFFEVDNLGAYPQNSLKIFNRYGNLVFEAAPYQNDWDGRNGMTGDPVADGAYFYVLDKGNGSPVIAGDVVVVR